MLSLVSSNNTVGVRMPIEDRELLKKVCKLRREDVSDFVRRSVRKELASLGFLTIEDAKALGMVAPETLDYITKEGPHIEG